MRTCGPSARLGERERPLNAKRLRLGLVLDPQFYVLGRSVCALTPPLIRALSQRFDARLIWDQTGYDRSCEEADFLVSLEPDWAAPVLKWRRTGWLRRRATGPAYVVMSDPHAEAWREDYFLTNRLDFVLALYYQPTLRHFRRIQKSQVVHFPWAIPEQWLSREAPAYHGQKEVVIFGAAAGEAYATRNWCRQQPHVRPYPNSGCENKVFDDRAYFEWLKGLDAVVAAGSEDPCYRLTLPKYFEAAAAGCLLFAQETEDLDPLGFRHGENCLIFTSKTFNFLVSEYLQDPGSAKWLELRRRGWELIRERHTLERRLSELEAHVVSQRERTVAP